MMDDAGLERLAKHVWGKDPTPVYAILDGARDDRIHPAVLSSGLPYACLLSGDLEEDLARAAPYLVQIEREAGFTRRMLTLGWGQSWGILLASPAPLEELRRHFRRLLRVMGPHGKPLWFRYYDPRVLRGYLPTCAPAELAQIFGPVARYLVEGATPAELLVFRPSEPKVSRVAVDGGAASSRSGGSLL